MTNSVNTAKLQNAFGVKKDPLVSSVEDNDVNINIHASPVETVKQETPEVDIIEPTPVVDPVVPETPPAQTEEQELMGVGEGNDNSTETGLETENEVGDPNDITAEAIVEGEGVGVVEETADEVLDDEVAIDLDPLDDADEKVEEALDDVEELEESIESLNAIYQTLDRISTENMPVSPAVLLMTQTALNNAVKRFGLNAEDCGVYSAENVDLGTIVGSMEGVSGALDAAVKQLKLLIKKLGDQFLSWLDSLDATVTSSRMLASAEAKFKELGNATLQEELKLPDQLDGSYTINDYQKGINLIKAFANETYGELQNISDDDIRKGAVGNVLTKATLRVMQSARDNESILPGVTAVKGDDLNWTLNNHDTESKVIRPTIGTLKGMLDTSRALFEAIKGYSKHAAIRRRVTKQLDVLADKVMNEEGKDSVRQVAKWYASQIKFEQRLISTANRQAILLARTVSEIKTTE